MRHAAKTDAKHVEYVRALEALGWTVDQVHHMGRGGPDAIASKWMIGDNFVTRLLEFKNGPKDKLTKPQERFHGRHDVRIIRSLDDCAALR